MRAHPSRRTFLEGAAALGGATLLNSPGPTFASLDDTPALLGGTPVRTSAFPGWPVVEDNDRSAWSDVLASHAWCRLNGSRASEFEAQWASRAGSKHALATSSGTTALYAALNALNVGPGDEVIVPPYTFIATLNVILQQYAIPVFVDTDIETLQIDATKIESAISERTTCLLPVHIGGSAADLDTILEIAHRRKLPVLEDACQSHLAQWRGKALGTWGSIGCFSFQASKNLNCGEGGALLTQSDDLIDACRGFHNNGRGAGGFVRNGCNLRITEFQAALLLSQLQRLEQQMQARESNGAYLTKLLAEIPGITPARMYEGCTRNAYHLYMFRYDTNAFDNLPRGAFLKALAAEGVPASGGYSPIKHEKLFETTLRSKGYRAIYPEAYLNDTLARIRESCPVNDQLCDQAVWFSQTMLLGPRADMDQIAAAIRKIQKNAAKLRAVA